MSSSRLVNGIAQCKGLLWAKLKEMVLNGTGTLIDYRSAGCMELVKESMQRHGFWLHDGECAYPTQNIIECVTALIRDMEKSKIFARGSTSHVDLAIDLFLENDRSFLETLSDSIDFSALLIAPLILIRMDNSPNVEIPGEYGVYASCCCSPQRRTLY
ncbi:hypothetical protein Ciccas_012918 [Cichlidogyrus casuarinus]|uniref:Uncharacterized protein n=1 Tax=Cichlidogyrus casuarinus TaxID=1844966 RepID=A0ABD2PNB0_9PLAT